MSQARSVRVARVYAEPGADDGARILVDRLWPRGIRKSELHYDEWCKVIAPSTALRTWYGHVPERFDEFSDRYRAELEDPERAVVLAHLSALADRGVLTLLTAVKSVEISHAAVLATVLASPQST